MLSRSNSSAADRLRRTKSTSSNHTVASGHLFPAPSGLSTAWERQDAETAAVKAYQRALPNAELLSNVAANHLHRRRSQNNGHCEGSHLANARLGRRRSIAGGGDGNNRRRPHGSSATTIVEPQCSAITHGSREPWQTPALQTFSHPSYHAADENGSPTSRNYSKLRRCQSSLHVQPFARASVEGYDDALLQFSTFGQAKINPMYQGQTTSPQLIQTLQANLDDVAISRERCRQECAERKLKTRKSRLFAPFRKWSNEASGSTSNNFDRALPPFNMACHASLNTWDQANVACESLPAPVEAKPRECSRSLGNRFRNAFRRASKPQVGRLARQLESDNSEFRPNTSASKTETLNQDDNDPFTIVVSSQYDKPAGDRYASTQVSTARSRVTSWTNTTVAGMSSIRSGNPISTTESQTPSLARRSSMATLKKAASFLGRPITRDISKFEMKCSEQSQGLYDALQDRLASVHGPTMVSTAATAAEMQHHGLPMVETSRTLVPPTIKRVMSDSSHQSLPHSMDVADPDGQTVDAAKFDRRDITQRNDTPQESVRRGTTVAPSPPETILNQRFERWKDNWKAALDHHATRSLCNSESERVERYVRKFNEQDVCSELHKFPQCQAMPTGSTIDQASRSRQCSNSDTSRADSPLEANPWARIEMQTTPRPTRSGIDESENPYELPGISSCEVKDDNPQTSPHAQLLSPSIYSRATDGATPRRQTPDDVGSTIITITGREVKRYNISPTRAATVSRRPIQGSAAWRQWYSEEMGSLETRNYDELTLPAAVVRGDTRGSRTEAEGSAMTASDNHEADVRPLAEVRSWLRSTSSASCEGHGRSSPMRSRDSSRGSKFMNERYPMLSTLRTSSDQSVSIAAPILRHGSPTPGTLTEGSSTGMGHNIVERQPAARKSSAIGAFLAHALGRSTQDNKSAHTHAHEHTRPTPSTRSTGDLRVRYRQGNVFGSKPLPVRRRPGRMDHASSTYPKDEAGIDVPEQTPAPEPFRQGAATAKLDPNDSDGVAANHVNNNRTNHHGQTGTHGEGDENAPPLSPGNVAVGAGYGGVRRDGHVLSCHRRQQQQVEETRSPGQQLVTNWLHGRANATGSGHPSLLDDDGLAAFV